jgi:hypothetical protein
LPENKQKEHYLTYRPFYAANGLMVQPGVVVRCTEVEAMCVNTMHPMTLRKMKEKNYEDDQK